LCPRFDARRAYCIRRHSGAPSLVKDQGVVSTVDYVGTLRTAFPSLRSWFTVHFVAGCLQACYRGNLPLIT
jgi:hypothetical protein